MTATTNVANSSSPDQELLATTYPAGTGAGEGEAPASVPAVSLIPLRNRSGETVGYALVDPDDLARLSAYRWSLDYRGYAIRCTETAGKQRSIRMHREVLNALSDPREVDHRNRNRLDNRKMNLRLVTRAQNIQNRTPIPDDQPQSGVRGVRWDPKQMRWAAFLGRRRIGSFESIDEAVDAISAALDRAS